MRRLTNVVLLAGLLWPATEGSAQQFPDRLLLTIRTYAGESISPDAQLAARVVADRILRAADLDVRWRACDSVSEGVPGGCTEPIGRAAVAVRFVRLPAPAGRPLLVALGYALVDPPTGRGVLATVYVDRVDWLAAGCETDATVLLGLTMAHEIGHLLLGTTEHASAGLMRAAWSCEALRRDPEDRWRFEPRQARAIRDSVRRRGINETPVSIRGALGSE